MRVIDEEFSLIPFFKFFRSLSQIGRTFELSGTAKVKDKNDEYPFKKVART